MKGVNDMEILDFVNYAIDNTIEVRSIEAMPFNAFDGNKDVFLSASGILGIIKEAFPSIIPVPADHSSSLNYMINDLQKIGIIPAYTRSLCGLCNRIRLTPNGELLTCLYSEEGVDLRTIVRNVAISDMQIAEIIKESVYHKKASGIEEEASRDSNVFRSMTTIGG